MCAILELGDKMSWQFTPYSLFMLLSGISCVITGLIASRRLTTPGSMSLMLLMAATAEMAFGYAVEYAIVGEAAKIFISKIEYLGMVGLPVFFLLFALEYTRQDKWLTKFWRAILWIIPLTTVLLAFTNEYHSLIWTSFTPAPGNMLVYGHGLWFWLYTAYAYILLLTGTIALIRAVVQFPASYRRQLYFIVAAALFPWFGSIIYLLGYGPAPGVDLMPVSMTLSGILLIYGMLRYQILDVVPIARYMLIENINDGILVLDANNRILDVNPAAETILGIQAGNSIGKHANTALKPWVKFLQPDQENKSSHQEIGTGDISTRKYLDLTLSPILDRNRKNVGQLAVFRDTTQRRQTEQALAKSNEELNILNRISLAITSGIEMEQVIKTLHEQCSQVASVDIFYVALYNETASLIQIPLFYERGHFQSGPSRDIRDRPGVLGKVISERKTIYLKDNLKPETRPLQANPGNDKPARSYLGIPLLLRDRVIGVISMQSYQPAAYSDVAIRFLERIAIQAAIALENARLYAEVQRMAIVDELTGIYNYRGLLELGNRELERARRFNRPLSVLFFDVDDFREFNNTYSHSVGNIVLKYVTECCQSVLRSVDILTRFGGDEFVALLPETDLENAAAVAHRMVENFAVSKVSTPSGNLSITVSIGVAELTQDTPDLTSLIDRANQAEHAAKQSQKGVVAVAH